MCTRFYVEPDTEEIREIIAEVQRSQLSGKYIKAGNAIITSGEIRPTNVVPVIAPNRNGHRAAFPMKWGFQIPGRSLIVNARTETAAEKPTFREAWEKRRCIIPASWYFEWERMDIERVRTALKMLAPEERAIIQDFFFTESPIPVKELVEKYAMPKTSIYRKRDDALKKLKKILGNA